MPKQVLPRVLLTPEVFNEIALVEPDRPRAREIREGTWGELYPNIDPMTLQSLPGSLHKGELEALALALQLGRPCLVDEKRVIRVARAVGLTVITSLCVLITAKLLTLILAVGPILDEMRNHQFRISDRLYCEGLRLAGE